MPKKKIVQPSIDPRVSSLEAKASELESRLARALADYQNLENRFGRESSSIVKFATASLLQKLLSVRDHLEMAASHLKDPSLTLILDSFDKILREEGVKEVATEGDFDPHTMECQEQTTGVSNKVIKVIQKGYVLHDRTLRPARVVVGNGQTEQSNSNKNIQEDQNV